MTKQEFIYLLENNKSEKLDVIKDMITFALNVEKSEFEIIEYKSGIINLTFSFGGNVYYNYEIDNNFDILTVLFINEYSQTTGVKKCGTMTQIKFKNRLESKIEKLERPYIQFGIWLAQNS